MNQEQSQFPIAHSQQELKSYPISKRTVSPLKDATLLEYLDNIKISTISKDERPIGRKNQNAPPVLN